MEKYDNAKLENDSRLEKYEDISDNEYSKKRELLENTKIVKQSWSIY